MQKGKMVQSKAPIEGKMEHNSRSKVEEHVRSVYEATAISNNCTGNHNATRKLAPVGVV